MRNIGSWLAGMVLVIGVVLAGPAHAGGRGNDALDDLLREVRQIQAQVDELEREASRKKGGNDKKLRSGLHDVGERLEDLEKRMRQLRRAEYAAPVPVPMDQGAFAALRRSVDRAPFTTDKLAILSTASRTQVFVVPQVMELLEEIGPSSAKLDALQMLWPRVLDRQNSFLIYDSFRFSGDRQRARAILAA